MWFLGIDSAPSDDKVNKYESLSLDELKLECDKRKIEFKDTYVLNDLVNLLIRDDYKPPDWGGIYSRVLYHTGMAYEEIARRTIPQIMAILDGAEENISIKLGMPNMFGDSTVPPTPQNDGGPPKLNQFMSMASMFSGI